MGLNAKLVVVGGDVKTTEIDLKLPAVIGRGRGASIMLPHPLVSRQHCELFENDGQLMVRDLGSLNGTYIGQDKVAEGALPPGSLLTIGAVTFRAVYDGVDPFAPPSDGAKASDTAIGGNQPAFGDETLPTDDVVVVEDQTGPAPPAPMASIIPPTTPVPRAAVPVNVPAPAPVSPADGDDEQEEVAEAEEDFQSFLKSLDGK